MANQDPKMIAIQQQLQKAGYNTLNQSGVMDDATRSAISDLNKKQGIMLNGTSTSALTNDTMSYLNSASAKYDSNHPITQTTPPPTPIASPQPDTATQPTPQGFDPIQAMNNLQTSAKANSDAFYQNQSAQLGMNLANQITQLSMAYEQAVADGELSVRDAQQQFEEQKQGIEKQAYLDAQKTSLYSQDMGIQNSQQAVGLMQGDNARNISLNNNNAKSRDKQINDIKTRLSAIQKQKNLDLANAQNQYGQGLLSAKAQADMMYNGNMFDLGKETYGANLNQSFTEKNMATQNQFDLGKMDKQQQFTLENMKTQNGYDLKMVAEQSKYRIQEMKTAHGFDLEKMEKAFANDLKMEGVKYGHQSALQDKEIAAASARVKAQIKAEQDRAKFEEDKLARAYKVGTPEYNLRIAQIKEASDIKMQDIWTTNRVEADMKLYSELNGIKPVADPGESKGPVVDFFTGYNKDKQTYDNYQSAIQRKFKIENDYGINPPVSPEFEGRWQE